MRRGGNRRLWAVAALTVTLAVSMPVVTALPGVVGAARSGSGVVGAWASLAGYGLAGKTNRLLLLVRCPSIKNDSGLVPLLMQPSFRNGTALDTGGGFYALGHRMVLGWEAR